MLLSAHTQQLTGYFEKSGQFLYFITNSRGTCHYANPFFHRVFGDINGITDSAAFLPSQKNTIM
jgi:hypothetical protein